MPDAPMIPEADDPHDLFRFVLAQERDYARAHSELESGYKRSHWMWFVFPQIDGLALSWMSRHYAIKSLAEARAYLEHPILGTRLRECAEVVTNADVSSSEELFGATDALKLRSCATLFACVSPAGSVFHRLLQKYHQGVPDDRSLQLLGLATSGHFDV